MTNQKGLAMVAIPLTLAILGLISTGALATFDHEKNLVRQRDEQRLSNIAVIKQTLGDYFLNHQEYPVQKDETINGWQTLENYLGNLPNDPLTSKGWSYVYWSDGKSYTLRYMLERNQEEQVVFGY